MATLNGLEYGASRIRSFESQVIPGLLQTAGYAEALMLNDPNLNKTRSFTSAEQQRLFDPVEPLTFRRGRRSLGKSLLYLG